MKKIVFFLIGILLVWAFMCNVYEIGPEFYSDYKFDVGISFSSIKHANEWVESNIQYEAEPDGRNYWQPPSVTFSRKKGDCEDKSILLLAIVYTQFGVKGYTWRISYIKDNKRVYHIVAYINKKLYDFRGELTEEEYKNSCNSYIFYDEWSYEDSMHKAFMPQPREVKYETNT